MEAFIFPGSIVCGACELHLAYEPWVKGQPFVVACGNEKCREHGKRYFMPVQSLKLAPMPACDVT